MSVLDLLRTSDAMPLSPKDLRFWRTVFPQMSRWLPDEEREADMRELPSRGDAAGNASYDRLSVV